MRSTSSTSPTKLITQQGFEPSLQNIYLAGREVVGGILSGWDSTFSSGVPADNYIGDIFGTLGGTPDFGNPAFNDNPVKRRAASGLRRRQMKGAWKVRLDG